MFTPRELTAAYKVFEERGPHYLDAETGLRASAYRFGERVLLVYKESEMGLVVLIHPSAPKENSQKFAKITRLGDAPHQARLLPNLCDVTHGEGPKTFALRPH
jgi:hypothetical protein